NEYQWSPRMKAVVVASSHGRCFSLNFGGSFINRSSNARRVGTQDQQVALFCGRCIIARSGLVFLLEKRAADRVVSNDMHDVVRCGRSNVSAAPVLARVQSPQQDWRGGGAHERGRANRRVA